MNQTLTYYSKKELQIVVIADMHFPDTQPSTHSHCTTSNDISAYTQVEPFGLCLKMMSFSFTSYYYSYLFPFAILDYLYVVLYSILMVDILLTIAFAFASYCIFTMSYCISTMLIFNQLHSPSTTSALTIYPTVSPLYISPC